MTTKKRNDTSQKFITKGEQALSPIGKKLLECFKNDKPVLLYGKDLDNRREEFVREVHMANGGKNAEFFTNDGKYVSKEEYEKESLRNLLENAPELVDDRMKDEESFTHDEKADHKESYRKPVPYSVYSTEKTWRRVNLAGKNSEEVWITLVFDTKIVDEFRKYYTRKEIDEMDYINELTSRNGGIPPSYKGHLFTYKGGLFIDNLHRDPEDNKYIDYYSRLAGIIKDGGTRHDPTTFKWVVAYTSDPDGFLDYFVKRFKLILLDSEVEGKKIEGFAAYPRTQQLRDYERWSINKKDKLEIYYDYENTKYPIKLTPLQFSVFCCLYKKIGGYVKIKTLEKCWKDKDKKPDYVDFVKDCVSKIRNKIKQELNKKRVKIYGNIIEPDNPKNTKAYKLIP